MTASPTGIWLTTAEVAQRLRLSVETVQTLARSGAFTGARNFKGPSGWRIPESSVAEFMAAKENP